MEKPCHFSGNERSFYGMTSPGEQTAQIRQKALAEGFDLVGISPADIGAAPAEGLAAYIAAGHHGEMSWMETRMRERGRPQGLWPECRSVIMLGMNYGPDSDPMAKLNQKSTANISVYAQNKDYHDLIKKRLKRVGRWVVETWPCEIKVFVDTAPVMEKPLAAAAGLGWQGKHTNLVSRDFGSWLFLGSIYTTLDLSPDTPETDHCGNCSACLDICPTNAFPAPYKIDARRCISYLTIEHKGHIDEEFLKPMGNRIYGCDDCLAVCPWNKFASKTKEEAFHPREELKGPLLAELAELDDASFRAYFRASPIKRIGRDRFVRNVMIAIGNSDDKSLIPVAQARLEDTSELVRKMAQWALQELSEAR
jgi:epoxyqueuosine reductase